MAWQVAVVVDAETEVEPLLGMMPVWAVSTPARKAAAPELWKNWNGAWANDPALTIWSAPWGENVLARLVNEIPTVGMHYQRVAYLRLFGVPNTSGCQLCEANRRAAERAGSHFGRLILERGG
jgi:hypothetical protein